MDTRHPLDRAADAIEGGTARLATLLGVTQQAISNWKKDGVPISRCVAIEDITEGAVTRRDLRPKDAEQIWPDLRKHGKPGVAPDDPVAAAS